MQRQFVTPKKKKKMVLSAGKSFIGVEKPGKVVCVGQFPQPNNEIERGRGKQLRKISAK